MKITLKVVEDRITFINNQLEQRGRSYRFSIEKDLTTYRFFIINAHDGATDFTLAHLKNLREIDSYLAGVMMGLSGQSI